MRRVNRHSRQMRLGKIKISRKIKVVVMMMVVAEVVVATAVIAIVVHKIKP